MCRCFCLLTPWQHAEHTFDVTNTSIRDQRDQLEARIVQRFREQALGRVVSGSFLHGVHGSHELGGLDQSAQAEVNDLIINHRPGIRCLLALASTCRLLRACAEPFLYRAAHLCPYAYARHIGLLLHYPHLTKHVRLLSFGSVDYERFDNGPCCSVPLELIQLSQAIARLLAQGAAVSREEIYRQLGPESFCPHGLNTSMFRAMLLFLLPDVRSFKFNLALPEYAWTSAKARHEWLFWILSNKPNDVWSAGKVPALQNLEEFSLVLGGYYREYAFDPRQLLPFLFLPKIRIVYTSSLSTAPPLFLTEHERSQWSGKSSVTEMIFDFAAVDGLSLDSLLRLPTALEKLTVNCNSSRATGARVLVPSPKGMVWHDTDRALGHAFAHQRHSLRKVTVRWARALTISYIRRLESFAVLEELTAPLRMVLSHQDGRQRSLAESLPASIVRLELFAYDHFPLTAWQLDLLDLLNSKDAVAPRLRYVRIEHWLRQPDGPASKYDLEVEAVVSLGRQVGVQVQVDFTEVKHPEVVLREPVEPESD